MAFSNSQFKISSFSITGKAKWKIKVITRRAGIKLNFSQSDHKWSLSVLSAQTVVKS